MENFGALVIALAIIVGCALLGMSIRRGLIAAAHISRRPPRDENIKAG